MEKGEGEKDMPSQKETETVRRDTKETERGRKMGSWVVETGKINLREHIYYSPSPYQVNEQKVMQE